MRHWPITELELSTPDLVLRLPSDAELDELAQVAAEGVVPDGAVYFPQPWASAPPAERARNVVQNHWWARGDWSRDNWRLLLAVFHDGKVIGQQNLSARDFATTGEARTGFWLGRRFQGQGYGTQMRAAALALAFDGLDAARVTSTAFADNASSRGVSRKFGYQPNGVHRIAVEGRPFDAYEEVIASADWQAHDRLVPVAVTGLSSAIEYFR
ncbi:GNAT family N-acetyltransferase [Streptomyces sp. MMS21 TC-5]|uniref:GNAT family N-acetyltransferase n=1 Tax=Streptomyces sp. MMS21 TC-5 TaxID=2925833 RepID=UPI001F613919|nr:GNAT family protein [Streptomyces sp. MMS21 TC-5]MCI4085664.1 GNAT family N-acetyltransferase [Streptomyces sp. MMS21 TC-5]